MHLRVPRGRQIKAVDIAVHWKASEKTAKRDIAELKEQGTIEHIGSAKKGLYLIKRSK
ncbi:MAG: DeoR family transcriptional regulator [Proteobacteria bacterium]|nr:DeoR family transcriptional regulator [Pseudomonadota bacterium]